MSSPPAESHCPISSHTHSLSPLLRFISLWLCWVCAAAHRLSLDAMIGAAPHCSARLLLEAASLDAEHGLKVHRLQECGALSPRHADLPGPGIKPTSPALAGGFLTTGRPGKPHTSILEATGLTEGVHRFISSRGEGRLRRRQAQGKGCRKCRPEVPAGGSSEPDRKSTRTCGQLVFLETRAGAPFMCCCCGRLVHAVKPTWAS